MRAVISSIKLFFFGLWSFLSIVLGAILNLIQIPNGMEWVAKHFWSPVALFVMQTRIKVEGFDKIDPKENYLIMANHNSFIDIPVLFKTLPFYTYFIAKKELRKIPLLGWYIKAYGMIYIDRSDRTKAKQSIAIASSLIQKGKHVIIFPEGTKSKDGNLGPFKKGGFHLAAQAGVPILPIKLHGARNVWPNKQPFNLSRGKIEVVIADPIYPEALENMILDDQIMHIRNIIDNL
jgi:1-acyl-sn-glycerol-3-phosphate acyltransferase